MKCKIRNQLIYFKRNAGNVLGHFDGRLRGIEVFTLVTPWNITVFIWGGSRGGGGSGSLNP